MTAVKKSILLPGAAFGCAFLGLITWALRWRLLATAVDEKGLLAAGHPLSAACWILAALTVLLAVLCFRKVPKTVCLSGNAVSAVLRAVAMIVACVLFWDTDRHWPLRSLRQFLWDLWQSKRYPLLFWIFPCWCFSCCVC